MTKQQMFERSVRGLAAQNWARAMLGGACVYRTPGGLGCALGVLMSRREAVACDAARWLCDARWPTARYGPVSTAVASDSGLVGLAVSLQAAHDACGTGSDDMLTRLQLRRALARVGEAWSLEWPEDVA